MTAIPPCRPNGRTQADKFLAYVFGVGAIVILLIIAIFYPNPSHHSQLIFRVVLAIAAAGLGAVIPGIFDVPVSVYIRASGALALFAAVFFFYPKGRN